MKLNGGVAAAAIAVLAFLGVESGKCVAQVAVPPLRGEETKSMGQPQMWKPYVAPALVWYRGDPSEGGWQLIGGVYRDLLGPAVGAFGVAAEAYYANVGGENDGGFRAFGRVPFIGLQLGADYAIENSDWSFVVSFRFPWRRGGPLGRGDSFRLDYLPGRHHSLSFGLSVPIFQPWAGKTRPQRDTVELPKKPKLYDTVYEPSASLRSSLDTIREMSAAINVYTTPFMDMDAETDEAHMEIFLEAIQQAKAFIDSTNENFPNGHTAAAVTDAYHRELEKAYTMAAGIGDAGGTAVAEQARRILRDEVVFPYNRLLGQRKRRDSLYGFGMRAEEVFAAWLFTSSDVPPENHPAVLYVTDELIKNWDKNRHDEKRQWGDSRLVWIPLHYVIKPDEADTQEELNAILEAAVGQKLTDANDVHYVINEMFQGELYRMIHAARDYHVLWIHDYRGKNGKGKPDEIGYAQTVDSYLAALTNRVLEFEKTRKIPVYMIFLDQIYYEANDGELWLSLLEDPLDHRVKLPAGYEEWEKHIEETQQKLREAVAASPTLQAGRQRYGENWLKNKIKVQVNITNIADMSFRSNYLFGWVPFVPDVLLRDHRKISFYDVTELDPSRGEAIFTGMGVGEHYAGPTWDDRAILVRGPALLHLKDEARALLLSQGFTADDIPLPLRELPEPDDYDEMLTKLRAQGWTARTLQVYNATGYGMKWSNMLKGTLYNLMPAGTTMIIPDSLWNSFLWGGMMVGAALRGCWVFPISPALANAPSDGLPQMARANELFTRLLLVQNNLGEEIEEAGGRFAVGIYDAQYDVGDAYSNISELNRGAVRSELFREVFPFDQSVFELFETYEDSLKAKGWEPVYLSEDAETRKPKLHLKTQLFISREATQSLVPLKEWKPVVDQYLQARAEQIRVRESDVDAKMLRKSLSEVAGQLGRSWYESSTAEQKEHSFFFLTVGSHNMDYRGKIMDGEATVLVAGTEAMLAYLDFAGIVAKTTWIQSVEQLNELLPAKTGGARWLSRFIKNAL